MEAPWTRTGSLLTIEFPVPSPETAREASQHVMTIRLMTEKDSPSPGSFAGLPSSLGQALILLPKAPAPPGSSPEPSAHQEQRGWDSGLSPLGDESDSCPKLGSPM